MFILSRTIRKQHMTDSHTKPSRRNDVVISICQNNQTRSLALKDANEHAIELFGWNKEELLKMDFRDILPVKIRTLVDDNLEFEDGMGDIGEVLSKVRGFAITAFDGREVPLSLKVLHGDPIDRLPRFDLLMHDNSIQSEVSKTRNEVKESLKGYEVIDEIIGLPSRVSFLKELEMVSFMVNNRGLEACLAIVEMDDRESMETNYGKQGTKAVFRSIGHNIRGNLREDDSIGVLSEKNYGIILMDASVNTLQPVLNRLRYKIGMQQVEVMDFQFPAPKVSMGYCQIKPGTKVDDIIKTAEQALGIAQKKGGNYCEAA